MSATSASCIAWFPARFPTRFERLEHGAKRFVERRPRPPAGRLVDLARVPRGSAVLRWPQARRVLGDLDSDAGELDQAFEQRSHRSLLARTDVVDLAADTALQQREIAAHDVANVGEVARDVDVADRDDRRTKACADLRDLADERGDRELLPLSRTDMVERSRNDDALVARQRPLATERLRRDLADRVGIARRWRLVLVDRQSMLGHVPIDIAGAHEQQRPRKAGIVERAQQVERSEEDRKSTR